MFPIMGMKGFTRLILLSIATSGFAIEKNPPPLPLPSAVPSGEWTINGSFLIWQSKEWGLEFAAKSYEATNLGTTHKTLDEKSFVCDFAWRSGLKLTLGRQLPYDAWDTQVRWVYYHGQLTNLKRLFESVTTPAGVGVVPLWYYPFYGIVPGQEVRYGFGQAHWKLYFNSLDWELGRANLVVDPVSIRFHVGLKGAWLRQQYHVDYANGIEVETDIPGISGPSTLLLQSSGLSFKSDSWGLGPRAGFGTHWIWGYGIGVFAEGAFTLMYSSFETYRRQTDQVDNITASEEQTYTMNLTDQFRRASPVGELILGFDWSRDWRSVGVLFRIAYEMQYWWAQNGFRRNYLVKAPATTEQMRGDLQMHGLTATLGVDF